MHSDDQKSVKACPNLKISYIFKFSVSRFTKLAYYRPYSLYLKNRKNGLKSFIDILINEILKIKEKSLNLNRKIRK